MTLTHLQVAAVLRLKPATLRARAARGNAPKGRTVGGRTSYDSAVVRAWINAELDNAVIEHSKRLARLERVEKVSGR